MDQINTIIAKIKGIKYTPFLCRDLNIFNFSDLDKALSSDATFILKVVCQFIHKIITNNYGIQTVLDPTCGRGNLLKPFIGHNQVQPYTFDTKAGIDFLSFDKKILVDLVLCNPPFNLGVGHKLDSEVFLNKIIEVTGEETPIVLFTPMGFWLNIRGIKNISNRYKRMVSSNLEITSIVSLPLDIFENVEFHSEILLFNMPKLKPHYWLPLEVCKKIKENRNEKNKNQEFS